MISLAMIEDYYAQADALNAAGDKAGSDRAFDAGVAIVERAAVLPVGREPGAVERRLAIGAYVAQDARLEAMIVEAVAMPPLERLIALRALLAQEWGGDDLMTVGIVKRSVDAIARPCPING